MRKWGIVAGLAVVLALAAGAIVVVAREGPAPESVRIVATRDGWRFEHNGVVETDTLTVPGGVPIAFRATSADVRRNLWFPSLRFRRQLEPGHEETFTLTFPPDRLTTSGACSNACGGSRSGSQFDIEVLSREDYAAWVRNAR